VAAASLTAPEICAALSRGDFYSSTGVELTSVSVSTTTYEVTSADPAVVIEFVGAGGRVLARGLGPQAAYRPRGGEGYVRARVIGGGEARAWTQPVFVR
jgi:hypothetical protein